MQGQLLHQLPRSLPVQPNQLRKCGLEWQVHHLPPGILSSEWQVLQVLLLLSQILLIHIVLRGVRAEFHSLWYRVRVRLG